MRGNSREARAVRRLRRIFAALDPDAALATWHRLDAPKRALLVDAVGAERDEDLLRALVAPRTEGDDT